MAKILQMMADEDRKPDGESLVCSIPGGWWLGYKRLHAPTIFRLIRLVAISQEGGGIADDFSYWRLNSEGRYLLENIEYVPKIFAKLQERELRNTSQEC